MKHHPAPRAIAAAETPVPAVTYDQLRHYFSLIRVALTPFPVALAAVLGILESTPLTESTPLPDAGYN